MLPCMASFSQRKGGNYKCFEIFSFFQACRLRVCALYVKTAEAHKSRRQRALGYSGMGRALLCSAASSDDATRHLWEGDPLVVPGT